LTSFRLETINIQKKERCDHLATTNKTVGTISGSRELVDHRHTTTQSHSFQLARATTIAVCVKARRRLPPAPRHNHSQTQAKSHDFGSEQHSKTIANQVEPTKAPRYSSSALHPQSRRKHSGRTGRLAHQSYRHTDQQILCNSEMHILHKPVTQTIISNYSSCTKNRARPRSPPLLLPLEAE